MNKPKTCKDWKNKVVQLHTDLATSGGDVFRAGELLVVKSRTKKGDFLLARHPASIILYGGDNSLLSRAQIVGDLDSVFKDKVAENTTTEEDPQ